mmetsp:Transcript_73443/g.195150  ORF Transcript_73443/g.195150 Transcript_73443/m.195150 type:complete len:268 (+) Transcript_73443:20-823(+)
MTSPTLVPASHAGSKRLRCSKSWGRSAGASTGSSENSGSRPSCLRTCSASERYSRFTPVAASTVGTMRTVRAGPSSTRQQRPCAASQALSARLTAALVGTRSALQPMPCCLRCACLSTASCASRARSSFLATSSRSCALHSLCISSPSLSASKYPQSPMGSRHLGQHGPSSPCGCWQGLLSWKFSSSDCSEGGGVSWRTADTTHAASWPLAGCKPGCEAAARRGCWRLLGLPPPGRTTLARRGSFAGPRLCQPAAHPPSACRLGVVG